MKDLGIFASVLSLVIGTVLTAPAQPSETAVTAVVSLVIDGDTVILNNGEYVRYLGIDTPEEGEEFYWAAKSYNRRLVWRKKVYLEIGPERRDGYGRLLAYIWVEREGKWLLVNEELLRKGLAKLLVIWPDHYHERLLRALTLAQVEKRGLWGKYRKPFTLEEIEQNPVQYVTEVVTVDFVIASVEARGDRWYVRAINSRYGFHTIVHKEVWGSLGISDEEELIGKRVEVTGELRWDNLLKGPHIEVLIPEQWTIVEE
jgi:endonuclease YncB( thermonuclease family)